MRKVKTSLMLTSEARAMLERLAESYGLSMSATLECIIRADYFDALRMAARPPIGEKPFPGEDTP